MFKKMKVVLRPVAPIIFALFAAGAVVFAWTEPSVAPPGGNVAAPLNVSNTAQTKTGNLILPNLLLNAVGSEGNISAANQITGYDDIFIKGNSAETAPVYLAGNQISAYTSGTERLRINSSGNVGIGTASPANKLDIYANNSIQAVNIQNAYSTSLTTYGLTVQASNPSGSGVGVYGIGGGSSGVGVRGQGGIWGVEGSAWGSNSVGVRGSAGASGGAISYGVFGTNGWPGGYGIYCDVSGGAKCGGNSGWFVASDGRLKNNTKTISNALDKVLLLRGVNFNWKDPKMEDDLKMGFIAQEVLPVVPEVVKLDANGYYTMEQGPLTALLVEAVKELKAENEALKLRIEALESK